MAVFATVFGNTTNLSRCPISLNRIALFNTTDYMYISSCVPAISLLAPIHIPGYTLNIMTPNHLSLTRRLPQRRHRISLECRLFRQLR